MTGYGTALKMLGLQEVRDREELMAFFKKYQQKGEPVLDPSITPWCARFVGCCERSVGNPGTGKDNARSYENYGKEVPDIEARTGDIVVFERGSNGWQGHVTYFVKWDDYNNTVIVLGGNQRDSVCEAAYIQDRIVTIRRYE